MAFDEHTGQVKDYKLILLKSLFRWEFVQCVKQNEYLWPPRGTTYNGL